MILSIIIPVYNTEDYLQKCIESCLKQNVAYGVYEIIIINDGSTDDSLAVLNRYKIQYNNVLKVFSQENRGLSEARNLGIKHALGKYIWFVDSDDWIETNCLLQIFSILENEAPDILRFQSRKMDVTERVIGNLNFNQAEHFGFTNGRELLSNINFSVCATTYLVQKSIIENNKITFISGLYHEDMSFTTQIYLLSKKVLLYNKVLYYVRETPSSITRTFRLKKSIDLLFIASDLYLILLKKERYPNLKFTYLIGVCVTAAINNLIRSPKSDFTCSSDKFVQEFKRRPEILYCLLNSRLIKYRLLGLLINSVGMKKTVYMFKLRRFFKK